MPHEAHAFGPVWSAATLPALLDAYLRPQTAVKAEDATSLLHRYPTVFTCRPASLLLIPGAVQLASPSPAKLQLARSTSADSAVRALWLHHNHLDLLPLDYVSADFHIEDFGLRYV